MPSLTNSYVDCRLFNLDPHDRADGPFVVAQEAYDPTDLQMLDTVFLLRRDGTWINEMVQHGLPEERRYLVFFDSAAEAALALEVLGSHPAPVIERHDLTIADLRARLADLKLNGYTARGTILVQHYRAWKLMRHS